MSTRFDPVWRLRLARDDAAAAAREAVDYCHDVEFGLAAEPDIVFYSRRRRQRARRRLALARWICEGYGRGRMEGLA